MNNFGKHGQSDTKTTVKKTMFCERYYQKKVLIQFHFCKPNF